MIYSKDQIDWAVSALQRGEVIAHPTETVFGLAADPGNDSALERILALKGRARGKGFIILLPDRRALAGFVDHAALHDPLLEALADKLWPGPLTLVLPARDSLSPLLTGGRGTIAVRHSPSALVADILAAWGGALVSTSANRADSPILYSHEAVIGEFGDRLGHVLPGSCPRDSKPSTIVALDRGRAVMLRAGAMPVDVIADVLSRVDRRLEIQAAPGGS